MANMGYCRFQNTLKDLRDCRDEFASLDRLIKQLQAAQTTAAKFRLTDGRGGYIDSQLGSLIADLQNGQYHQYDE